MQKLQSLIYRHMQPWQPDKVLHIGLLSGRNMKLTQMHWGNNEHTSQVQVYLQWCVPMATMLHSPEDFDEQAEGTHQCLINNGKNCVSTLYQQQHLHDLILQGQVSIDDSLAFSDSCDTKWFGSISNT
jgi:hypothetical protein